MDEKYTFEPANKEIVVTGCIGNIIMAGYYSKFVKELGIGENDRVLDYYPDNCIISKKITEKLKDGELIFADSQGAFGRKTWIQIS